MHLDLSYNDIFSSFNFLNKMLFLGLELKIETGIDETRGPYLVQNFSSASCGKGCVFVENKKRNSFKSKYVSLIKDQLLALTGRWIQQNKSLKVDRITHLHMWLLSDFFMEHCNLKCKY